MPNQERKTNQRIASLEEQIIAQVILQAFLKKLITSGASTTLANHERIFAASINTTKELITLRDTAILERTARTQSN